MGDLIDAATSGDTDRVKQLIKAKADVNAADTQIDKFNQGRLAHDTIVRGRWRTIYESTPLHEAADKGHTEVLTLLIEARADVKAINVRGHANTACLSPAAPPLRVTT